MRFIFLGMFFTLFAITIKSMENDSLCKKLESKKTFQEFADYCTHSTKPHAAIINAAHNPRLLAYCAYHFLPNDVSKNIGSYLCNPIATKYKHKLIKHKWWNKDLTVKSLACNKEYTIVSRHDGTYYLAPGIEEEYATWDSLECSLLTTRFNETGEHFFIERTFTHNKELSSYYLYGAAGPEEKQKFMLSGPDNAVQIRFVQPATSYSVTYDGRWVAFGFKGIGCADEHSIILYQTGSLNGTFLSPRGPISTMCSAHQSAIFAIGNSKSYKAGKDNLVLIEAITKRVYPLKKHTAGIVVVEFSPDDTRLLTCSYDKKNNKSQLVLWDIRNLDNIQCIYDTYHNADIQKAFFINNGQQIVSLEKNGCVHLFNGLTGKCIQSKTIYFHPGINTDRIESPAVIWSNKHELLIRTFDKSILISKPHSESLLGKIVFDTAPQGIGLTAGENKLVIKESQRKTYQLLMYNEQDCKEIDFIEHHATLINLYEIMITLSKKEPDKDLFPNPTRYIFADIFKEITALVEEIKSYIHEQQKKREQK